MLKRLSYATFFYAVLFTFSVSTADVGKSSYKTKNEKTTKCLVDKKKHHQTRHFVRTSLGQVHYIDAGCSKDIPVVMLHQTPRSTDEYAEVIPIVAKHHRVIAIDTPGYGSSDKPHRQPTVQEYAKALIEVLDSLSIRKAHFLGHHSGGILAFEIAGKYPERVGKLIISGPIFINKALRSRNLSAKQWHVKPDGSHLTKKWNKLSAWTQKPSLVNRILTDILRAGETSEYGHLACAKYRMEETLPLVKAPTLLLVGTKDRFLKPENYGIMLSTIPKATKKVIDGGGVFQPNERPEEVARLLIEFL